MTNASLESIEIHIENKRAFWNAGEFSGDEVLVEHANLACIDGTPVKVFGARPVVASTDTPLGAFVALYSYNPKQAVVVASPAVVRNFIIESQRWDANPWGA